MQSTVRYRQVDKERRGRPTAGVKQIVHNNSGVAKGAEGAVAPCTGGQIEDAKQPRQNI